MAGVSGRFASGSLLFAALLIARSALGLPFSFERADAVASRPESRTRSLQPDDETSSAAPEPEAVISVGGLPLKLGASAGGPLTFDPEGRWFLATRYAFTTRATVRAADQKLGNDPKGAALLLARARLQLAEGKCEAARGEIEQGLRLEPSLAEGYLALADCNRLAGDSVAAERTLERASAAPTVDDIVRFQLGELLVLQGRTDAAIELFTKMSGGPSDWAARKRLAELYLEIGKVEEAAQMIYALLATTTTADLELHYLHARMLLAKGDVTGGTNQLQQVQRERPSLVAACLQLALARVRENNDDSATAELAECLRQETDFAQARYVLALLQRRARRHDLAEEQAERVLPVLPDSFAMKLVMGDAALGRRDFAEARQTAEQLVRAAPQRYEGRQLLGRALAGVGRSSEAVAELEQALKLGSPVEVLADLVAVLRAGHQPDAKIIQRVREFVTANPDSGPAKLLLAKLMIETGDTAGATVVLEDAVRAHPGLSDARFLLAGIYGAEGKLTDARRHLEALTAANPNLVAPQFLLGIIDETDGQVPEAVRRYKRALELSSGFAPAKNNLAWLRAERENDLEMGLELARQARASLSEDPYVADTLGWILHRRGLHDIAVGYLKEAAAKLPENPEVRYHLGMAYLRKGETERGRTELQAALSMSPFPSAAAAREALGGL